MKVRTPRIEKKRIKKRCPTMWRVILATRQIGYELRKLGYK